MNLDALELVINTAAPIVGAVSDLISQLLANRTSLEQARSQLRAVLSTASERLDRADTAFKARDAAEDARIASGTLKP